MHDLFIDMRLTRSKCSIGADYTLCVGHTGAKVGERSGAVCS